MRHQQTSPWSPYNNIFLQVLCSFYQVVKRCVLVLILFPWSLLKVMKSKGSVMILDSLKGYHTVVIVTRAMNSYINFQ